MNSIPLEPLRHLRKILCPEDADASIDWLAALRETAAGWQAIADGGFVDQSLLHTLLAETFLPAPDLPSKCVLLAAARDRAERSADDVAKLDGLIVQVRQLAISSQKTLNPQCDASGKLLPEHAMQGWWFHSMWLRADIIQWWFHKDEDIPTSRENLARLLQRTRGLFRTDVWDKLTFRPSTRPHAWKRLHEVHPQTAKLLDDVVSDVCGGWHDPAAALLSNTLLALDGPDSDVAPDENRRDDGTGSTWILIAVSDDYENPTGMLLRLSIEVIPEGCGVLYPHPESAAHIVPHRTFQSSLRNAWSVVLGATPQAHQQDYRWSVSVIDDSTEQGLQEASSAQGAALDVGWHRHRRKLIRWRVHGRSGEAAIASALKSAVTGIPLDGSKAVTAYFAGSLPTGLNPPLRSVKSVVQKALGIREIAHATRLVEIDQLVLASRQTLPAPLTKHMQEPVSAADFDTVFNELSRDAIVTQKLKERLRDRDQAIEFFRKECFGNPEAEDPTGSYLLNPMTRMPDDRDPPEAHRPDPETGRPKPIALSEADQQELLLGLLRDEPNRTVDRVRPLRLVADSGMGKTTLLWRCLYEIASDSGPRIPILLQSLSDYLKRDTEEAFLAEIAGRLKKLLPDDDQETGRKWDAPSRLDWLTRTVRRGEAVFLLDALDQTSDHVRNLNGLVDTMTECPFLLTLRPESRTSKAFQQEKASGVEWDEVDVQPFTEAEARRYLDPYDNLFFNRLADESNQEAGSILTIPLILHLLRDYAITRGIDPQATADDGSLPELKNRYTIYEHVICGADGLIARGVKTLEDREREVKSLISGRPDAIRKMSRIAFRQVRQHHFDNILSGRNYQRMRKLIQRLFPPQATESDVLTALEQIDLVTAHSMIEQGDGFAWRHRSFFEFLAGCRLAELFSSEKHRQRAINILFDIHNCLAEDGSIGTAGTGDDREPYALASGDRALSAERAKPAASAGGSQAAARSNFRDLPADWQWTLRFALAHAHGDARDRLAMELIALGNPWVVYEAIDRDKVTVSADVNALVRWLVYQNWTPSRGFTKTMNRQEPERVQEQPRLAIDQFKLTQLAKSESDGGTPESPSLQWARRVFDRATPDAGCLFAAAELQPEPPDLTRPGTKRDPGAAGFEDHDPDGVRDALAGYVADHRFVRLLPPHDELEMADFPVTNAWFELFCPSHRRWRNQYSSDDDQPVLYVSWYMADMFCRWLSAMDKRYQYRLATEKQWEAACTWGTTTEYWWNNKFDGQLCWCEESRTEPRTRSRQEAIAGFSSAGRWHPSHDAQTAADAVGLLDLSGNVWEWCSDAVGSSRVLRGGSWNHRADNCRSSFRNHLAPDYRSNRLGFRVVRVLCSSRVLRPNHQSRPTSGLHRLCPESTPGLC